MANKDQSSVEEYEEEGSSTIRRLRVAAMHGILRPIAIQPSITDTKKLKSFEDAIETAIADATLLRQRGFSLLNQRFPTLNTTSIIHQEDFQDDSEKLPKRLLQRMRIFNLRRYNNKTVEKFMQSTLSKLGNPTLTIGVLGRIKCGKSTLLNAITCSDLFPTDTCNPETSVIVSIRHSNSIHVGPCDESDPNHGKGLKCPQLQTSIGQIVATTSYHIQRTLSQVNIEARNKKTQEQHFTIVVNIPILATLKSAVDIVLQDTPGLGEATSPHNSAHITDLAETALLTCSAYIYVLDCSKLRDQLDVAALQLLKTKDHEVYQDGRLVVAANHFDRTIQPQPGPKQKKISSTHDVQLRIQDMFKNDINEEVSSSHVITSIAYWAWYSRVIIDMEYVDLDELNMWRKQYERALNIIRDRKVPVKQFIEEASGVQHIENWLHKLSTHSNSILQKSKLSDTVYCSVLCINACDEESKKLETKIEELVTELEVKRHMWNDAIKLIQDIEIQLEMFKSILEAAYESDIQEPKQRIFGMATEMLALFQESCCKKCRQFSVESEDGISQPHPLIWETDSDNEDPSQGRASVGLDSKNDSNSSSDDDLFWDQVGSPVGSPLPHSSLLRPPPPSSSSQHVTEHNELPSQTSVKYYRVVDFRQDIHRFIHELENRINDYLGQVRFVYIPRAIPLEEFGENKKQLYQYAANFLHTKIQFSSREEQQQDVYEHPRPDEIQDILVNQDISLNQLKERTEIKVLKLGWLGRIRVWLKAKFGKTENAKENHIMKRSDVNSAINYLREKKCLEECGTYLDVHVKENIVECYHSTFSQHVKNFLQEYEKNCLTLMTEISSMRESEMQEVIAQAKQTSEELNYLINANFMLRQLKDDIRLNFSSDQEIDLSVHEV